MSINGHRDGLFLPSLFYFKNDCEKKAILKQLNESGSYSNQRLTQRMLDMSNISCTQYRTDDKCVQRACEFVALKFMLCDTDLAKELLSEDELSKANESFARKQFDSRHLKKVLHIFYILIREQKTDANYLFYIPIIDAVHRFRDEEVQRTFGQLKKVIENVASGVKSNCYNKAEGAFYGFPTELNNSLNSFFAERTGYDFNLTNNHNLTNKSSTLLLHQNHEINNRILQLSLVNDESFWDSHKQFNVVIFLNEILKSNDISHAKKVLSLIIDKLQAMPNIPLVIKNGLPLYMSEYDTLVGALEEQARRFSFKRLEPYCSLSALESVSLCFPMSKVNPAFLEKGKYVWERFIKEYNYPFNFEKVLDYLTREVDRFASGKTHEHNDIAVILDSAPFRYEADNEDRRWSKAYHQDCFSAESIWKRVYLKAHAVTLLSNDEKTQFSYLQRIFPDLIKEIEKRIGICTAHQLDTFTREAHFEKLKNILSKYGINVRDEHKSNYIISLLDRDTALMEEEKVFPILEQIGDAIYGLATAELLFYNPNTVNMAKKFENITRAQSQVAIAKCLNLDKLFLHRGLPAQYVEFDTLSFNIETLDEEHLQTLNQEKYLADALEMIIGSIYCDAGMEKAIAFSKQLLLESFPNLLKQEIHPTEENKHNRDIDMDYWAKILPSPCSGMSEDHRTLWKALNKVILIASLGTEDVDKRRYITNSFGSTAIYNENLNFEISWTFYNYLVFGLNSVLEKSVQIVRDNYKNKKL